MRHEQCFETSNILRALAGSRQMFSEMSSVNPGLWRVTTFASEVFRWKGCGNISLRSRETDLVFLVMEPLVHCIQRKEKQIRIPIQHQHYPQQETKNKVLANCIVIFKSVFHEAELVFNRKTLWRILTQNGEEGCFLGEVCHGQRGMWSPAPLWLTDSYVGLRATLGGHCPETTMTERH